MATSIIVVVRVASGLGQRKGIEISLSREELAQMSGATLFTISRVLSGWSEKGLAPFTMRIGRDHRSQLAIKMPTVADISSREIAKRRLPGSAQACRADKSLQTGLFAQVSVQKLFHATLEGER